MYTIISIYTVFSTHTVFSIYTVGSSIEVSGRVAAVVLTRRSAAYIKWYVHILYIYTVFSMSTGTSLPYLVYTLYSVHIRCSVCIRLDRRSRYRGDLPQWSNPTQCCVNQIVGTYMLHLVHILVYLYYIWYMYSIEYHKVESCIEVSGRVSAVVRLDTVLRALKC